MIVKGDTVMALTVEKNFFATKADVYEDLGRTGYWPTTFVSGPSEGLERPQL